MSLLSRINILKNTSVGEILLFLLIYTSEDTMLFGTFGSPIYNALKYLVLVGVSCYMLYSIPPVKKDVFAPVLLLLGLFVISAMMSGWLKFGFIYNIILILAGLIYANRYSLSFFRIAYCRIIEFLSVYSLIIYFVNLFIPSLLSIFPLEYNVVGNEFRNTIFSVTFSSLPFRNFGIFREPGVFMVYINIALFLEWFSKESNLKRIFIYVLTLLTTVSTGGFIIGAVIYAGGAIYRRQTKNILVALPLIILAYYIAMEGDNIYSSLLLDKVADGGTGTTEVRLASIYVPLQIFMNSPLGVGPDVFNQLFPIYSGKLYGEMFDGDLATATFFKQLAVNGILVCAFYFIAFVRFIRRGYSSTYLRILFFVVLFLALINEDMRASLLFNLMVAYGLSTNRKGNFVKNEIVLG
ncbi:hypothetical protein SAMN06298211_101488 [Prevotellaceae bacterium MN60]|nr:hypothetical protein SAMN06298211_101488 [Prevotellaceae bacterium MN60]